MRSKEGYRDLKTMEKGSGTLDGKLHPDYESLWDKSKNFCRSKRKVNLPLEMKIQPLVKERCKSL